MIEYATLTETTYKEGRHYGKWQCGRVMSKNENVSVLLMGNDLVPVHNSCLMFTQIDMTEDEWQKFRNDKTLAFKTLATGTYR